MTARLRRDQDAFGLLMLDLLERGPSHEVIERDDHFFMAGRFAYLAPPGAWPANERRALRYARGHVLDIGCGGGRHALYLQGRGLDVLGIDVSPLAIEACRRRGLRRTRVASIDEVGPRLGTFDTIVMLGNNFGLFGNPRRAKRLLRRLHRATSPGARIIAESLDPHGSDDPDHLAYHRRNRRRGRLIGQLRLRIYYRHAVTPWFEYMLVSKREMEAILAGTGWRAARYLDGPRTYIAVIEKS